MSFGKGVALALIASGLPVLGRGQSAVQWCDVERWGSASQGRMWNQMYRETYGELRKADPASTKESEKRARKLLDGLLEAFVSGRNGAQFVGYTIYLLAVSEERLGRLDDAAWHWQMAQNLVPELRDAYDDFPDLIPFLREHVVPAERFSGDPRSEVAGSTKRPPPPGGTDLNPETMKTVLTPPELKHKVKPKYPRGAKEFHLNGATVVDAYIDTTGIPRAPTVKQGCGVPVFDVAAMDAIRQWRYKPASLEGKPISVWLTVTVAFELNR